MSRPMYLERNTLHLRPAGFLVQGAAWACVLLLAGCGERVVEAGAGSASGAAASTAPVVTMGPRFDSVERSLDAEVVRLRAALDFGHVSELEALLPAASRAGREEPCLRARAMALMGRRIEALRLLAEAKQAQPWNPDVGSTAAEIYAGAGAFDDALREILALEKVSKLEPAVLRARGVAMLLKEGGASTGLALLEQARTGDPLLPFTQRALAQAHLLVGKERAKAKDLPGALLHARASGELDALDVDGQRFLSECLAATGLHAEARRVLDGLAARGVAIGAEIALLEKRAGFDALLRGKQHEALDHFAAARRAGLDEDALGSAAQLLREAASEEVTAGVEAFAQGELAAASERFERALRWEPDQLAAMNHLAVCRMKQAQPQQAAELWRRVLDIARDERLELPEPVHVNLARALAETGDVEGAKLVLLEHLDRNPSSPWVRETERALQQLSR